jgi:hypothetical protein
MRVCVYACVNVCMDVCPGLSLVPFEYVLASEVCVHEQFVEIHNRTQYVCMHTCVYVCMDVSGAF